MDNKETSKELLLFVATTFVSVGAVVISTELWTGVGLLILGALVFVGRGIYKKYLIKEEKEGPKPMV